MRSYAGQNLTLIAERDVLSEMRRGFDGPFLAVMK